MATGGNLGVIVQLELGIKPSDPLTLSHCHPKDGFACGKWTGGLHICQGFAEFTFHMCKTELARCAGPPESPRRLFVVTVVLPASGLHRGLSYVPL